MLEKGQQFGTCDSFIDLSRRSMIKFGRHKSTARPLQSNDIENDNKSPIVHISIHHSWQYSDRCVLMLIPTLWASWYISTLSHHIHVLFDKQLTISIGFTKVTIPGVNWHHWLYRSWTPWWNMIGSLSLVEVKICKLVSWVAEWIPVLGY